MKNQVSNFTEFRKYYLSEYELYDGECFITFNLVGVDLDRSELQVAVSDRGRISVITYDLMADKKKKEEAIARMKQHQLSAFDL